MPKRDICKLCLQEKDLQESHLIPRAMYKMSRERGFEPVVMTPQVATHTSRQIRDYVLCWDCEQRFSRNGEKYVLGLVFNGRSFPLLDRLQFVRVPKMMSNGVARYTAVGTEVDTRIMAYFALSVIWRAAVHQWQTIGEQTTSVVLNDEQKEAMRKYLLGQAVFPSGVKVVVSVCMDEESKGFVFTPFLLEHNEFDRYSLLTRGIYFRVTIGASKRLHHETICCVNSLGRYVHVDNCREHTVHAWRELNKTAKVAQNLKQKEGKQLPQRSSEKATPVIKRGK